jgi:hypothetical protein
VDWAADTVADQAAADMVAAVEGEGKFLIPGKNNRR